MDMEAEIRELRRRVGELEGGWGFLTSQIRDVHRDLLGFQAETDERLDKIDNRLDKVDKRLDKIDNRLDKVDNRLDRVECGIKSLRDDLPGIVGDAVREVLRDQRS